MSPNSTDFLHNCGQCLHHSQKALASKNKTKFNMGKRNLIKVTMFQPELPGSFSRSFFKQTRPILVEKRKLLKLSACAEGEAESYCQANEIIKEKKRQRIP